MTNNLEAKIEDETLSNVNITGPTLVSSVLSAIPAAITADAVSGYLHLNNQLLQKGLTSASSDFVVAAVYQLSFPLVYLAMNRKHYTTENGIQFKKIATDVLFKIGPTSLVLGILIYHIPRNILQTAGSYLVRPSIASLMADTTLTAVYIPLRKRVMDFVVPYTNIAIKAIKDKSIGLVGYLSSPKRLINGDVNPE